MPTPKRRPNPAYIIDRTRAAGHIPADFTYRTKEDIARESAAQTRQSITHRIRAQRTWGLAPLGYMPAKIVTWVPNTDTWQPLDTDYGHPYIAIHWNDTHDFHGQWYARVTVIVPDPPHAQPGIAESTGPRNVRTRLSNNWTDARTGLLLEQDNQAIYMAPGVPVYTKTIASQAQFNEILASQDLILFTDPEQYVVYAALLR